MARKFFVFLLIFTLAWSIFPDFVPGPIDDLIAVMIAVIDGISLLATKGKAAKDAVELLASGATTQSR